MAGNLPRLAFPILGWRRSRGVVSYAPTLAYAQDFTGAHLTARRHTEDP